MIEVEDVFSENDKYLIEEYVRSGTDDFLIAGLGDKNFVVPYKYTVGLTPEQAISNFKEDLLRFQYVEEKKYNDANRTVRRIYRDGDAYVVPFDVNKSLNESDKSQIIERIQKQAENYYNYVITLHRNANQNNKNPEHIDFNKKKVVEYKNIVNKKGYKKLGAEKTNEPLIKKQDKINFKKKLLKLLNKKYKTLILAGTIAVVGGFSLNNFKSEKTDNAPVEVVTNNTDTIKAKEYVDFMGKVHSDKYGNIARLNSLKSDIMVTLAAVEGFADSTYKDGKGVKTIGFGSTFLIDENGKHSNLKTEATISVEDAKVQQWRFIEKNLFTLLGDQVGRSCSDNELIASVGAAYCWGRNAFSESNFYQALKDGESIDNLERKLTGFRKQKGLLKREYLLACCLRGQWTTEDLLDLPIGYSEKHNQYLGCCIYATSFEDIMKCKKGKDGKMVPVVDNDDYCTLYTDQATTDAVLKKMKEWGRDSCKKYMTIRDIVYENAKDSNQKIGGELAFNSMYKKTMER